MSFDCRYCKKSYSSQVLTEKTHATRLRAGGMTATRFVSVKARLKRLVAGLRYQPTSLMALPVLCGFGWMVMLVLALMICARSKVLGLLFTAQ